MTGFAPIIGESPRVLILGSMPSQNSLSQQQYYAHPQNAFWWIIQQILGFDKELAYQQRCQQLCQAHIAVWDVLHDCQRPGSLDSNIVRDSEQPNDLPAFIERYPDLRLLAFNGGAAKQLFMRHFSDSNISDSNSAAKTVWRQLPSTSPAYASMSKQDKLMVWRNTLNEFLK